MHDRQDREHAQHHAAGHAHDPHAAVPGRATQHEEEPAHHEALADGAEWEDISAAEGEQVLHAIQDGAPGIADENDEEHDEEHAEDAEEELEGEQEHEAIAAKARVADEDAGETDAPATAASSKVSAKQAKRNRRKVASSAFITKHEKDMRNYRYKPGTHITNTQSEDYGEPNTYGVSKVKTAKSLVLSTISVDVGTVVGKNVKKGHVLVFHKTHVKQGKKTKTVPSGDRTGWVAVAQLPGKAQSKIVKKQKKVRAALAKGKGSGHSAKRKGRPKQFQVKNPSTITNDYQDFPIRGSSDDGGTPLGAYTTCDRYGLDVIVGVWNPPGSGAGGKRFGGSGGIRAYLPATDPNFRFRLTTVSPVTVFDKSGRYKSEWYYIEAKVEGGPVFCWVLQSWTSPNGNGHNFTV